MTTEVVNLLDDVTFITSPPSDFTNSFIFNGNSENWLMGDVTLVDNVLPGISAASVFGNTIEQESYRSIAIYQTALYIGSNLISKITEHKIYIRFESNFPDSLTSYTYASLMGSDFLYYISSKYSESIMSSIFTFPDIDMNEGESPSYGAYSYFLQDISQTPPESIGTGYYVRNGVLVDITVNQDYFTSLGLTTDEEIQEYLDSIPYDGFADPE